LFRARVAPADLSDLGAWLDERLAMVARRSDTDAPVPGRDCATCRFVPRCPAHGVKASMFTRRDGLVPAMLALSPTALESWHRCPREWRDRTLLNLPPSNQADGAAHGLLLHRLLNLVHRTGSCQDDDHVQEVLLAHGADSNSHVDSAGNAVYAARTPELRALLMARGGTLDPYDLVWLDEDDEVMRRVTEDPSSAELGCGGVFTAVCTRGKQDLLLRLLDAGIRVPPVVTGCHSYLLENTEMLRILLASGMNPDLPNWQRRTFLHDLCSGGKRGQTSDAIERARILLDAGASISARDEEYRSTPLAWAARTNMPEMVEFLLARGAPANLADDPPWAAPRAWACAAVNGGEPVGTPARVRVRSERETARHDACAARASGAYSTTRSPAIATRLTARPAGIAVSAMPRGSATGSPTP